MKIGYVFGIKERNLTGINREIRSVANEILRLYPHNQYYALQENYLGLDLIENNCFQIETKRNYDYCGLGLVDQCDVIHTWYMPIEYMYNGAKKIITINDIIPIIHPEWFEKRDTDFFENRIKKSIEIADAIITISESTKNDVSKVYGVNKDIIHTVYLGADSQISYNDKDESVLDRFNLKDEFALSVCTIEPRKNLRGTIQAFIKYKKESNSKIKLALCGRLGWDEEFMLFYEGLGEYKEDIRLLGFVNDKELGALYKKAKMFVYNSFYEGFGLPILEAMKAGKAVLTSETSSMPEVGGEAVCYCNPYSIDSMCDGFSKILDNTQYRKELEKRAIIQSKKFSCEKAAQGIMDVYNRVLKE